MHNSVNSTCHKRSMDIFPSEAWGIISETRKRDNLIILDVSTPKEFKALHLEGAVNVSLFSRFFKARLDVMDKNKDYLVYCKLGGRSKIGQRLMIKSGFRNVYNIKGGTLLWEEEGFPFASGTDGTNRFAPCPFFISIVAFRKVKKLFARVYSFITSLKVSDNRAYFPKDVEKQGFEAGVKQF